MRKLALVAGVIAVFGLGIALLILSIDTRALKTLLVDKVKARTGQTLHIDGPLRWGFYHGLQLEAGETRLSSPAGYRDPYILQAKKLSLHISLPALLTKDLVIKRVQFDQVETAIEVAANGVSNWDALLEPVADAADTSNSALSENSDDGLLSTSGSNTETPASKSAAPEHHDGWQVSLRSIRINDGKLIWRKGEHQVDFEHLNMMLSEPVKGRYPVEITSEIHLPDDLIQLSYQGQLSLNHDISVLSLTENQLRLSLQSKLQPEREPQLIDSRFSVLLDRREGRLALSNISIDSPIVKLGGELILKSRPVPGFVDINLNSPYLDLDEVLPLWRELSLSGDKTASRITSTSHQPDNPAMVSQTADSPNDAEVMSSAPADISAEKPERSLRDLYQVDGFVTLRIQQIRWRQQPFQQVSLDATVQQGVVDIDQFSMQGLGGDVSATGRINLLSEPTQFSLNPVIRSMPVSSVMAWLNTGFNASGMFNASGRWQFSGWPSLQTSHGFLTLQASDVSFDGINLSYLLSSTVERLRGKQFSGQPVAYTTHLNRLLADLNLQNGQIKIARLNAQDDKLLLNATGTLDWAAKQCQLQINNRLDLGPEWSQLSIPLQVYGSFNDLRYRIDAANVLKQQLRANKQRLLDRLQSSDKLSDSEKKALSEL
ncbi:AsmA family protein [Plesiomonas shigelloides]|uniref:AsmA family protein n=1 Tax=Plesiomonas shigelloides TaxID=703 RepID=UPI002247179B|nr:AsmA family protein [Plesiomonas shigelloides]MCX2496765.1 AsmA family protein [Plesiomonas shigelloides]